MVAWKRLAAAAVAATTLFSATATAATLTEEQRTIVQVFEAPGADKLTIYTAGRQWIAENFRSAKAVIEYESKDEGTIIGNGVMNYPCASAWECLGKPDWKVPFTMRLEAKDERFRLTFTNIHLFWPPGVNAGIRQPGHDSPVTSPKDMAKIKPKLLEFGEDIKTSLSSRKADDNW